MTWLYSGTRFCLTELAGSFDAWCEWIPDYAHSFTGIDRHVGDTVKLCLWATSASGGVGVTQNLTTGQKGSHQLDNTPSTLCQTNAGWIVEDFQQNGSQVPLVNVGSITFDRA
ncbi:hypothetical protein PWT90_06854 [Aphanocladium album]|nr:hypothetical protein PWT90_06854 [Aphanocladium album]